MGNSVNYALLEAVHFGLVQDRTVNQYSIPPSGGKASCNYHAKFHNFQAVRSEFYARKCCEIVRRISCCLTWEGRKEGVETKMAKSFLPQLMNRAGLVGLIEESKGSNHPPTKPKKRSSKQHEINRRKCNGCLAPQSSSPVTPLPSRAARVTC